MAAIDASKFTTSDQIFSANHTLPQIRSIHKALHVEIEDKASRLRTRVGGSYRDLLGTADTIVQMHEDNDAVQELLRSMGWRCGRAVVSTKVAALANFVEKERKADVAEAARQRLLDGCLLVVGRLLRGRGELDESFSTGDRLVVAAKVLVLSRLLVNSLGKEALKDDARQAVDAARKKLDSLRRRLRRTLEKALEKIAADSNRDDVLKALAAHSLANSSGAKDTLRHFFEVRFKAVAVTLDSEEDERVGSADDVIRSLELYARTLLDVQALVPNKLSQALHALTKKPLLEDASLRKLEGLRLDIFERWCGEDIQYFTPFIRHDDLSGTQAKEMFDSWVEKGQEVLLRGLKKILEPMHDFKSITELRTNLLQLWIRQGSKVRGIDPEEMQNHLRHAINTQLLAVLESKVTKLHIVGSEVKATLESWKDGVTGKLPGLWDEEGYEDALSSGARPFLQEVASRFYGRSDAVSKALNCYYSWFHIIDDVKEVVGQLEKQRWDNDFDEIEDEETLEARQQLLSKDDPKMLQQKLDTSLDASFEALEKEMQQLWHGKSETGSRSAIAMYLIRVLRDIRRQLPQRESVKDFGLSMVPALHQAVVVSVSELPVDEFVSGGLSGRIVVGRPLWDGDPALPNQPAPETFQFLHSLLLSLSDAGVDLWTAAAMTALKQHVSRRLCEAWNQELQSIKFAEEVKEVKEDAEEVKEQKTEMETEANDAEGPAREGEKKDAGKEEDGTAPSNEQLRDLCIQWLFDISLLRLSVGTEAGETADEFQNLEDAVYGHSGLDESSRQHVGKAAKNFWSRTSLLFGLLA
ncbi:oligomeric Golgi complex component [Trichoderma citrinoviride]|uniref:Conserved oligomeric Golgi complex subunit 1 n=1 Tax=Trichoderma citrinoviride TaxID=58853 RepID=A0A2T4BES9_9HYPO|nr:oligomeric Golgi complex component [Trichoderma citrinoviride]PTB67844.1 oligomeric Golgi complex component [Trichoderma citrinoviride]